MGPEGGSRGHRIYIFILQFLQEYIPDGTKEMIELQGLACVINAKSYSIIAYVVIKMLNVIRQQLGTLMKL